MANENIGGLLCFGILLFFGFWTLFSIIGAIHYAVWYPRFELQDVHIRTFNVNSNNELTFDMDILIFAHHFSPIRAIEQYSYEIRTSHVGTPIGSSSVPGFHPVHHKTLTISTTQTATLLPMTPSVGAYIRSDLNTTGRVAVRVYIEAQVYTNLFLAQKERQGMTCDLIVSPGLPFGSQIYDKLCCGSFACFSQCSDGSCCSEAPNCCTLPPSSLNSTISICG